MDAAVEKSMEWILSNSHWDVIRPGDTLVVQMSARLEVRQAAEMKALIEERLPGVNVLVVGCDGIAVYRP